MEWEGIDGMEWKWNAVNCKGSNVMERDGSRLEESVGEGRRFEIKGMERKEKEAKENKKD